MQESEIKTAVENFLAQNTLDASVVEVESSYDDNYIIVSVEVARKDFERAVFLDSSFDEYSIRWEQRVPPLVGAEVGDLVLIYSPRSVENEDVGFVSSKFMAENGDVYYGCRYVQICLNNQFANSLYDFQLTQENYGGFPKGFLKVLTAQEAVENLRTALNHAYEKEKELIQSQFERSGKKLDSLISYLGKTKTIKCDTTDLDDCFGLSLKIN